MKHTFVLFLSLILLVLPGVQQRKAQQIPQKRR